MTDDRRDEDGPAPELDRRTQGLLTLARLWWPIGSSLTTSHGPSALDAPPGQRFLPLPPRHPRILVPLENEAAAAGTLTANLRLNRPSERLVRTVASTLIRRGLMQRLLRDDWVGIDRTDSSEPTLLETLRTTWTPRVAAVSFTLRRVTPNYKPTFVAVDASGSVLGYGKMGPTVGTSARLEQEAEALHQMGSCQVPGLSVPAPLAALTWQRCSVLVVSALPHSARRYPSATAAPTPLVSHGLEVYPRQPAEEVANRLTRRIHDAGDLELSAASSAFVERFSAAYGGLELAVGRGHGDWVPWNVAVHQDRVWAWDWEHSQPDSAVALDILHWHQFVARERLHVPLAQAIHFADERGDSDLARLGVPRDERRALVTLSRLHLAARAAELFRDSGMWPPGERATMVSSLSGAATAGPAR